MKKAIAMIIIGVMVLQVFSILVAPVSAEIYDDFLQGKLDEFVRDEIIVKFKAGVEDKEVSRINSRYGTSFVYRSNFAGFHRLKIPNGKMVSEMIEIYKKNPNVEYAEPNYIAHACMAPNDPYYSYQWHLHGLDEGGINMEPAWDISTGLGVIVAVIDTGIAYEDYGWRYQQAPDLAETCFVAGYDFVNDDSHPNDDSSPGHGTHVAGTIAQSTNNNLGVAGVAFDACLMPVKVLDRYGSGTYSDVAEGIIFAVDNGAQVISLSLGGSNPSETLENAVAYAYDNDVIVVAAAGNDGSSTLAYPAAYDDYVIAVGATRYDKTLAYYSNYGPSLDIVAPGGDLNVDQNNDGYGDGVLQQTFERRGWRTTWGYYFMQGTSMATPHVSGAAALLIANGNAITPDEIRVALQETAEDLGVEGRDDTYGWGLVDAYAALQWTAGPVDNPPTITITDPVDGATVVGTITIVADASDDHGVEQVEFFVNDFSIGIDPDGSDGWSTIWDSTSVADGSYTIKAEAIDTASQSSSDLIGVVVDNVNDPPIADAGLDQIISDADGNNIENAILDGSASYDPDGTISSYEWAEGTIVLGTTAVITYDFSVGTHTVTLTVTDDKGASSTDECIIDIVTNQAPVADAGPDQSVYVGDTVEFDGSGSYDPDGIIVSYEWDFGDGTDANGVTVSHVYSTTGTYTVTLTVTDNGGLTDSDQAIVTVEETPSETVEFYDSFEVSEWNGLWVEDSQNDWRRLTQRATDGSRSAEVDGRATDATLTMADPIDLSGKSTATLTFSWFIEGSWDNGEYIRLDISTDGGNSWTENVASIDGKSRTYSGPDENHWIDEEINLGSEYMVSNFKIRFRAKVSSSREDGNVDNVKIVSFI